LGFLHALGEQSNSLPSRQIMLYGAASLAVKQAELEHLAPNNTEWAAYINSLAAADREALLTPIDWNAVTKLLSSEVEGRASSNLGFTDDFQNISHTTLRNILRERLQTVALEQDPTSSLCQELETVVEAKAVDTAIDGDSLNTPYSSKRVRRGTAVRSLAILAPAVCELAIRRRGQRFRAYARIWSEINVDCSDSINSAELGAYLRHRQAGRTRAPLEAYGKDLAQWSLKDMHEHFCSWMGTPEKGKRKFSLFERQGTGLMTWYDFVTMAERAFRNPCGDDLSFSRSELETPCHVHATTACYSVDMSCMMCEIDACLPWSSNHADFVLMGQIRTMPGLQKALTKMKNQVHTMRSILTEKDVQDHSPDSIPATQLTTCVANVVSEPLSKLYVEPSTPTKSDDTFPLSSSDTDDETDSDDSSFSSSTAMHCPSKPHRDPVKLAAKIDPSNVSDDASVTDFQTPTKRTEGQRDLSVTPIEWKRIQSTALLRERVRLVTKSRKPRKKKSISLCNAKSKEQSRTLKLWIPLKSPGS